MTNVEALHALYIALGGDAADVADCTTIVEVLNAIAAKYDGDADANLNPDAIANIAAVAGNITPDPTLENKTVTPTTAEQTISAGEGYDGLGTVIVEAVTAAIDSDITAGNIKKDVEILGVTGSYEGAGVEFSTTPAVFTLLSNISNLNAVIPSGITSIGANAFSGCTGLTSVDIPSGVTTIGNTAFSGCTGLTSVDIPSGVTTIGGSAFFSCTGLTSVDIPSSVTSIGVNAFRSCTGLTSVDIPSSVTTIGSDTFLGCTNLATITINKAQDSITGAPWGAPNATVVWTG